MKRWIDPGSDSDASGLEPRRGQLQPELNEGAERGSPDGWVVPLSAGRRQQPEHAGACLTNCVALDTPDSDSASSLRVWDH